MSSQTKLNIVLTIQQAVAIESALRAAIWNAKAAERSAREIHLATCADNRRQEALRTEVILATFTAAFNDASGVTAALEGTL